MYPTYSSLEQEVIKMSADQADLSKLIESLSQNDQGSTAQQALCNLLGVEVPLDTGVEGAAGLIAEKLGLNQKSTLAQTGMYVVTKAAILEGAALIGIGGGIAKLDMTGFQLAKLQRQVEAINLKLEIVLSTPLELAIDFLGKAMRINKFSLYPCFKLHFQSCHCLCCLWPNPTSSTRTSYSPTLFFFILFWWKGWGLRRS